MSNIILDELDRELSSREHRFVRYADDASIYTRSRKSADRVMGSITRYIESVLKLKVNRMKSKVSRPTQSSLLCFSFLKRGGGWKIRISRKSIERIREKIRQNTRRNSATSLHERLAKLGQIICGWVNYFQVAQNKKVMVELDKLVRRRLGVLLWKQWKTAKKPYSKLSETRDQTMASLPTGQHSKVLHSNRNKPDTSNNINELLLH